MATRTIDTPVERLEVQTYRIPTDYPEADGTYAWESTTVVIVQAYGGEKVGLGYTYGSRAIGELIQNPLADAVIGRDAMAVTACWDAMVRSIRNQGRPGQCSMAIAAVDAALWDLKARLLDVPLVVLLGQVREGIAVYGSGGFTSYPIERLCEQLNGWVEAGIHRVKMKVGTHPEDDPERVRLAADAIGSGADLFVDANGAYSRKQALALAECFADCGVSWFEEPVSSDDLEGLRLIRDCGHAGMDIAAGEYGYDAFYFRRMLEAGAVDVLQADASRCGGITEFLRAADLAWAFNVPLSAHTAPALHLHVCCAAPKVCHCEYFHDHVWIEEMLFEGVARPVRGVLHPDLFRPGMGLELKEREAERYKV
ncbi:enolase C-terminal domain-like protein [Methylocaldum szegediense]|uniref:L-talarate/galactarate dehydratase n=1 Tax=Methylocaldum szegediense TaxID=73780 RepID=A0ABM9I0I7_9GAMM|nr:enolase C-terminal domain-like protein [Methylocaldum szegediense]CAI8810266.1 L-talarate/galactarate dehydratase [Methylocaldum szegediense]